MLKVINAHERDQYITFQEEGHIYNITLNDANITPVSVTTIIHHFFPSFDADKVLDKMFQKPLSARYQGKTKEQIKEEWENNGKVSSELGTKMHADIENFLNTDPVLNPEAIEYQYFQSFWQAFIQQYPMCKPYRTEWLVFDEANKIAGSIDCVLSAGNDTDVIILDWKRSKEIKYENRFEKGFTPFHNLDNCNYSHYMLQLNIYRHMLETKYNKRVIFMMLVICHPDFPTYQCIPVPQYDIASVWHLLQTK